MENSNFEILTVLFFKNKIFSKFLVCSFIWFFVCFIDRRLKYKPLYIKSIIMLTNVTSVLGITHSASARHRRVMGLLLEPNRVIAKDVKRCTYCWYSRCATHYHALPDKVLVCYVVWLVSMIYGNDFWTSARCVGLPV